MTTLIEPDTFGRAAPHAHPLQLLLADRHAAIRASVRTLCEIGYPNVAIAETSDVRSTILFAVRNHPALLLIDMELPRLGGATAIRLIKERSPTTRIVAWALDPLYRMEALRAGADTFLLKGTPAREICCLLEQLAPREIPFDEDQ